MSGGWKEDELRAIGDATELQLASKSSEYTTMWVVRVGDDLYVRSAGGPSRPWYRRARAAGKGRIRAGGIERDVTFEDATNDVQDAIDDEYHAKYDGFGPGPVGHVTGPAAHQVTLHLSRSAT